MALPNLPKTQDPAIDFLGDSVTRNDITSVVRNGTIYVTVPLGGDRWGEFGADQIELPPTPPPYWSTTRDQILRASVHKESFWAGAIGIAISKIAALGFEIRGDVTLRVKRGRDIMLYADGRQTGYVAFISKHLRDFLLTDNGAFIEIVREGNSYMSKVAGIRHLDSHRCIRTGDPLTPVIYRDRLNKYHELKYHEVIALSDSPDPAETYNGVGICAASRAYFSIYKLAAVEWYLREKVSGLQPLAIHIVNGVLDTTLQGAVRAAKEGAISRGIVAHMGAVVIGIPQDTQPSLVTIPLAELPDAFNRKEEFDLSILSYANSIGLDPQDLQPLSGRPLGTGMQSEILADKAEGRGLSSWKSQYIHQLNEFVLSTGTTFHFYDKDYRDLQQSANLSKAYAETASTRIQAGITSAAQELQVLVDKDELPREFLAQDQTAGASLSDDEKPIDEMSKEGKAVAEQPQAGQEAQAQEQAPAPEETTEKEYAQDMDWMLDELDAAQALYDRASKFTLTGKAFMNDLDDRVSEAVAGYLSETLKHLQGKHDQKRHSWRYGANVPLSKLKNQRKAGGESEWAEYKARVRARKDKAGKGGKGKAGGQTTEEKMKIYTNAAQKVSNKDYENWGDNESTFKSKVENDPHNKNWNNSLSEMERSAIKGYTDSKYTEMNKNLRDEKVESNQKYIDAMQTALKRSEVQQDMMLYRGFKSEYTVNRIKSGELQKGGFFLDKGFMSSSPSKKSSEGWSGGQSIGQNGVVLRIKTPKGTKGAFMGFGLGIGGGTHEKEFVFPAGTAMYIENITFRNGKYYLDLIPHQGIVDAIGQ